MKGKRSKFLRTIVEFIFADIDRAPQKIADVLASNESKGRELVSISLSFQGDSDWAVYLLHFKEVGK